MPQARRRRYIHARKGGSYVRQHRYDRAALAGGATKAHWLCAYVHVYMCACVCLCECVRLCLTLFSVLARALLKCVVGRLERPDARPWVAGLGG